MNAFRKHSPTLLLVDDDPCMLHLLYDVIAEACGSGVDVRAINSASDARAYIEQNLVDILVTDLEMPGINGIELLRCAKHKNPCAQVLFITGHSTLEALAEALESGASDYLLKPLDIDALVTLVNDARKRLLRWQEALAGTVAVKHEKRAAARNAEQADASAAPSDATGQSYEQFPCPSI
jgi:DNA-binding NtrC family response regulator